MTTNEPFSLPPAFPPAKPSRDIKVTTDGNQEVLCPDCGSNYLHHMDVEVITRDGEDKDGTVTRVDERGATSLRRVSDIDIPGRRDSLSVTFWCEACGTDAPPKVLRILQHKGCTILSWVSPPWRDPADT